MTISLSTLQASLPALQELASNKFAAKTAYRLARVLRTAESEIQHLKTAHFDLVKRCGEQTEGDNWQVKPENMEQFTKEMTDLLAEEVELWGDPLPLDLLGDVQIEPAVLAALDWLVTDGEQVELVGLVNGKTASAEAVN